MVDDPQTPAFEAASLSGSPPPSGKEPPPPRRILLWILLALLAALLLAGSGLAAGYWALGKWGDRPSGAPGTHKLRIEPRTSSRQIAALLKKEGAIDREFFFLAWFKIWGQGYPMQAGDYEIQTPISPRALIQILYHGKFERTLTIPEGWTARQIARRLLGEGWIKEERAWLDLVARPSGPEAVGVALPGGTEGFCFPDTYRFEAGTKPEKILLRMLAKFRQQWTQADPARRDPRSAGLTLPQVVTLASMIEREARAKGEMPGIASVYLNRLKRGMKMECCATVRYALGEVWDRPLLYPDLKIESPYNTYLHPGLPPGPIANPGRPALEAVLRPAQTDFLFYVYAGNHTHLFSRTYAEHMKAVRSLRKKNPRDVKSGQGLDLGEN